ncbi:MAG TPA: hypothetical protein VGN26_03460, partial [Armatimonadota bacterium]
MTELLLLALLPLLMALLGLVRPLVRRLPTIAAALMAAQIPLCLWVCWSALSGSGSASAGAQGWGLDELGAAFVVLTTVVSAAAVVHAALVWKQQPTTRTGPDELLPGLFYTLTGAFIIAMYAVL